MLTSFYRTTVRPFSRERFARTIAIEIARQAVLSGTDTASSIPCRVAPQEGYRSRRRALILRGTVDSLGTTHEWNCEQMGRGFAGNIYADGRDAGVIPALARIPVIETQCAENLYLPIQFFSGDCFGQLYLLSGEGMKSLEISAVPLLDSTTSTVLLAYYQVESLHHRTERVCSCKGRPAKVYRHEQALFMSAGADPSGSLTRPK